MGFDLRPYQRQIIDGAKDCLAKHRSTLAVSPTGTGKTVTFVHLANEWRQETGKRVCIAAHREELVFQTAEKLEAVTNDIPGIEMGEYRTGNNNSPFLVTSIQSMSRPNRLNRFDPERFGLLIVDEAHHCVPRCKTYNAVVEHFQQNQALKLFGCTATPDRLDEAALGQMFESVCYECQLPDSIADGWLVDIEQRFIQVESMDLSLVRKQGDDFNEGDLAAVMSEKVLHEIARPTFELAGDEPTLVFTPQRKRRERDPETGEMPPMEPSPSDIIARILNGYRDGSAVALDADTPKEERRYHIKRYRDGSLQFLVSCGLFLEGFDAPNTSVIAMARPTLSRSLYSQAIGRGTRPLAGIVDGLNDPAGRRITIQHSAKKRVLVLDFVGQAGRHKLVSTADILGGQYDDDVIELAEKIVKKSNSSKNMLAALKEAEESIEEYKRQQIRKRLEVKSNYRVMSVSPFDLFAKKPKRCPGWHAGRAATAKQMAALRRFRVEEGALIGMDFWKASQMLDMLVKRCDQKLCTVKQAKTLAKHGIDPSNVGFARASELIDLIARNGWKLPKGVVA